MVKDERLPLQSLYLRADAHKPLYLSPKTEMASKFISLGAGRNFSHKRKCVFNDTDVVEM